MASHPAGLDLSLLNPPFPFYEQLRQNAPVLKVDELGFYLVTRYEDVRRIVTDAETFSSELEFGTGLSFAPKTPAREEALAKGGYAWVATLGFTDPPVHKRVRSIVQSAFNPRRTRQLEGLVEDLCNELIAGLDPAGPIDYAQEVALPLPAIVIGEALGVAKEDRARFTRWADSVLRRLGEQPDEAEDIELIGDYVEAELYFEQLIEDRRQERTDDFLSDLVYAQQEAEDPITDEELMSIVSFLPVAGSRTSAGLIGMTMHHLVEHPEHLERCRADPGFLDALIEEVLRLQSPIQAWFRRATRDVEVGGVTIEKDAQILVVYTSANRDEEKFECPAEFRTGRENIKDHVAFGWGRHFCPGSSLARAEARVATRTFLERFSDIRIAPGAEAEYHPNLVHRMVDHLPLVVRK